jgi:hypothetical protein
MTATTRKILTGLALAAAVGVGVAIPASVASAAHGIDFERNVIFTGNGASPIFFDALSIAEANAWAHALAAHGQNCLEDEDPIIAGHYQVTVTVRCEQ